MSASYISYHFHSISNIILIEEVMLTKRKYKHLNKQFKRLYKLSFPKDERLPKLFLKMLLLTKKAELYHYYNEDDFIGFIYSVNFDNFNCLAFFATNPEFRNQGYGKQILDLYSIEKENQIIFLNCELPENKEKDNIKFRRYSFYKRNGFILTPLIITYKNIDYLTLVNKEINNIKLGELNKMMSDFGCSCRIDAN